MRYRHSKMWVYSMLCVLLATAYITRADSTVQASKRPITNEQWEQLTHDEAFTYRNEIENVHPKKRQLPIERFFMRILQFFSGTAGKIIIWGFLFALLAFAAYHIFLSQKTRFFNKREKQAIENKETFTEDILETDWEKLLQHAARNGELRNAVRYSYMLLLQLLQRQELIQYRSDKTNYQYLADLTDTPYKQPFRQLSRQYEYTWYGNFPVAPASYEAYMRVFDHLKKQLGR